MSYEFTWTPTGSTPISMSQFLDLLNSISLISIFDSSPEAFIWHIVSGPGRDPPQNQEVIQSWTQIGYFAGDSRKLNPTRNLCQHINELFSAATSGNVIHPSLCLGKRTLQLDSSTGNHSSQQKPGGPPKEFL